MPRFEGLDALRGLAALSVVFFHYGGMPYLPRIAGEHIAVDLFFMIGGFLIAAAYEDRLRAGLGLERFILVRLVRVYPVYLLGLVLALAAALLSVLAGNGTLGGVAPMTALFNLLILPAFNLAADPAAELFPLNGPMWSLFFQMIMGAVYALALFRLPDRAVLLLALAAAFAYGVVLARDQYLGSGAVWGHFWQGFVRSAFSFLAGLAVYRFRERFPARIELVVLSLVALVYLRLAGLPTDQPILAFGAVILLLFPVMVGLSANSLRVPLAAPLFGLLSRLAYPMYVLHMPLKLFVDGLSRQLAPVIGGRELVSAAYSWAALALVLLVSFAVARYFDGPVRRWLNRRLRTDRPCRPAEPAPVSGR